MSFNPDDWTINLLLKDHKQCKVQAVIVVGEYDNLEIKNDHHLEKYIKRGIADSIFKNVWESEKIKYDLVKRRDTLQNEYYGTIYVFSEDELKSLIVNIFRQAGSIPK